jgi:hypothetical protein
MLAPARTVLWWGTMKRDNPKPKVHHFFLAFCGVGSASLVALPTTVVAWLPPPPPPPLIAPNEYANMTIEGVNVGVAWVKMGYWVQRLAESYWLDAVKLPEPTAVGKLPLNSWGKQVALHLEEPLLSGTSSGHMMYEVDFCRAPAGYETLSGVAACTWNLRIIEPLSVKWRYPEPLSENGAAWMATHFNPYRAAALMRTQTTQGNAPLLADPTQTLDLEREIRTNATTVTLYRGANCPQLRASILRLGDMARTDEPPVHANGLPPQPPTPNLGPPNFRRMAHTYIAPSAIMMSTLATDDALPSAPLRQSINRRFPRRTLSKYHIPNQMAADIALIKRSCAGEAVTSSITPPLVASPASP